MSWRISAAQRAIEKPDVQRMLQELSRHGLGVYVPHMHTDEERFAELPAGVVQVESEDLYMEFMPEDHPKAVNAKAVGWYWDEDRGQVVAFFRCGHG